MYAVIKTGGKQHKVAEGEILKVEKLKASEGEPVDITDVLLIEKDGEVTLGSPFIEGANQTLFSVNGTKHIPIAKVSQRHNVTQPLLPSSP